MEQEGLKEELAEAVLRDDLIALFTGMLLEYGPSCFLLFNLAVLTTLLLQLHRARLHGLPDAFFLLEMQLSRPPILDLEAGPGCRLDYETERLFGLPNQQAWGYSFQGL